MPISIKDINFHSLTKDEAKQLEDELNAEYPDLSKVPAQSNPTANFFQDHWMLLLGTGGLLVGAWFMYNQHGEKMQKRLVNLV